MPPPVDDGRPHWDATVLPATDGSSLRSISAGAACRRVGLARLRIEVRRLRR